MRPCSGADNTTKRDDVTAVQCSTCTATSLVAAGRGTRLPTLPEPSSGPQNELTLLLPPRGGWGWCRPCSVPLRGSHTAVSSCCCRRRRRRVRLALPPLLCPTVQAAAVSSHYCCRTPEWFGVVGVLTPLLCPLCGSHTTVSSYCCCRRGVGWGADPSLPRPSSLRSGLPGDGQERRGQSLAAGLRGESKQRETCGLHSNTMAPITPITSRNQERWRVGRADSG